MKPRHRKNAASGRSMLRASGAAGLTISVYTSGCGLGFVEVLEEQNVSFRIENETPETAEVTISVQKGFLKTKTLPLRKPS